MTSVHLTQHLRGRSEEFALETLQIAVESADEHVTRLPHQHRTRVPAIVGVEVAQVAIDELRDAAGLRGIVVVVDE